MIVRIRFVIFFFRNEGFVGFYKGLVPNILRVTPAASITFLIYENVMKLLERL
jgi:hypothetical protein